jgi:hypothetical protein
MPIDTCNGSFGQWFYAEGLGRVRIVLGFRPVFSAISETVKPSIFLLAAFFVGKELAHLDVLTVF